MSELEALRAYFNAHMDMHYANTEEAFARLYVKANLARDRLIQLEQEHAREQADAGGEGCIGGAPSSDS